MKQQESRSLDITGAFIGHVTTDDDTRALNVLTSVTVDATNEVVTTEYESAARPGARITNRYTDPAKRKVLAFEAECKAEMVAADAYRMAPVTPIPKPKRTEIPTITCPTCDGLKRFAGDPCPECLGQGVVPARD